MKNTKTTETTKTANVVIASTEPTSVETIETAKPAKKPATKKATAKKPAKKVTAKKATKKSVAKKATKTKAIKTKAAASEAVARKSNIFKLAKGVSANDPVHGAGQRAAIADTLRALKGATRAQLIEALPSISPDNISWHLSMMVAAGTVVKTAA